MVVSFLMLIAGFILLIKGSDLFVDGVSSVAKMIGIPSVIVGLTIVSMGTSAPEAAVSIAAGINGSNEIAISNLVGSNIFNILCVAGASAAIMPFAVDKVVLKRDFPVCIAIMVAAIVMCLDGNVSRLDGVLLLLFFIAYMIYLVYDAVKRRISEESDEKLLSPVRSAVYIVIGIAAIIAGAPIVVSAAKNIAYAFGMSETMVGFTIVAIGTSLPELIVSVVAAHKGESGIAIGNVVGSSIFNISFILGISAAANPIAVVDESMRDLLLMLGVAILAFIFCITQRKLNRTEGIALLAIYVAYTTYLIISI